MVWYYGWDFTDCRSRAEFLKKKEIGLKWMLYTWLSSLLPGSLERPLLSKLQQRAKQCQFCFKSTAFCHSATSTSCPEGLGVQWNPPAHSWAFSHSWLRRTWDDSKTEKEEWNTTGFRISAWGEIRWPYIWAEFRIHPSLAAREGEREWERDKPCIQPIDPCLGEMYIATCFSRHCKAVFIT